MLAPDVITYEAWIEQQAIAIKSDKCTGARDWNVWCCYEHDLGCHYLKDPADAFARFAAADPQPWESAKPLSRREVDIRFWRCNRRLAPTLKGRMRANIRYLGVRLGALWPFVIVLMLSGCADDYSACVQRETASDRARGVHSGLPFYVTPESRCLPG